MLNQKDIYLGYKKSYTNAAFNRYGLWLNKFEEVTGKSEEDITIEDILKFKLWLQVRYSGKSVEYAMTIVHNYFYFLKLNNVNCINPALIKSPKARANSHQAVSPDDYQKILRVIDCFLPQNELCYLQTILIVRIPAETGVRVSELTSIVIDKIDLNVCGSLIENRKNRDKRWIYWSNRTNELLKKFLPVREHLKRDTRVLFVGNCINGKGISTRSVQRIIKTCCERAGVKNVVPHSFRHGTAHNILEKGGNVADVQKTLGHRSPISSMKYLQYSDKEHQRRAKMFLQEPFDSIRFSPLQMLDKKVGLGI